jgi:Na+/proline symporter
MADFRNDHPECHSIADLCGVMWGPWARELVNLQWIVTQVLCTGSGILGISIAFNSLSEHGACSVAFSFVGMVLICMFSSIRTFSNMTILMYVAFASIMSAVLIVVIGVTVPARPAAAPQEGPFELGFYTIAYPTFAAGITASANIFISSAAGPSYLPVVSEMRRPHDYKKAAVVVGFLVGAIYLSFSMVLYAYCGSWVATPSLGSAGPLLKKVAYGVALPGLIVSGGIFNTTAAKSVFVRLLRGSPHLQSNSLVHWSTWIGVNVMPAGLHRR